MSLIQYGVNSFATLSEAQAYFNTKLYCDEWDTAADPTKEKALIEATNKINRLRFTGAPVDPLQPLQFPRIYPPGQLYLIDSDNKAYNTLRGERFFYGWIREEEIPAKVKKAVFEEALALLKWGNNSRIALQAQGVTGASLGKVSETYKGLGKLLSPEALEILSPYMCSAFNIV